MGRHSLDTGAEKQLTGNGGFNPVASSDQRFIYYSKLEEPGLWRIPVEGGNEASVIADRPQVPYWGHWAQTAWGIYVLNADSDSGPRIEFYDFATRDSRPVLSFEKHPLAAFPSLSATADGKTLYYTQGDQQSVIKMMEFSR